MDKIKNNTSLHILLIEDNEMDQFILKNKVKKEINPRDITCCDNFTDGLLKLEQEKFDLVLLDLNLPDVVEMEGIVEINTKFKNIPIIVLTGDYDKSKVKVALELGAQDYIEKDCTSSAIFRALKYAVMRKSNQVELIESRERAQELTGKQEELIAIVSHDLKRPLANIRGLVELLLTSSAISISKLERDGVLKRLQQNTEFGLNMITELLEISSINGEIEIKAKKLDITTLISDIVKNYQDQFDKEKIELSFDCEEKFYVLGDSFRLSQVVHNLLDNAIKFVNSGDKVEINITRVNGKRSHDLMDAIEISVKDNGPGIDKDKIENIFNKFEQVKVSDRNKGYGLGLAICKKICQKHKGDIWVESSLGQGCTFYFRLPLLAQSRKNKTMEHVVHEKKNSINAQDSAQDLVWRNLKGKKVSALLIDDDESVHFIFKKNMERIGVDLESVANKADGLNLLRKNEYDIIFLDENLGDSKGVEILEMISDLQLNKASKIVAISSSLPEVMKNNYKQCGVTKFLGKPLLSKDLDSIFDSFFGKKEPRQVVSTKSISNN